MNETPVEPTALPVQETASKMHRTRAFVKTTFTHVGVPVLIGTAAFLIAKKLDTDTVLDAVTPE